MILFKLRCNAGHEFEGWFRDGAAYERQSGRGLISCATCGDTAVDKAPMAPRLGRGAATPPAAAAPSETQLRHMLRALRQHVEAHCDNVGDRFAEEARRIERGEADRRGIYGGATEEEVRSLTDEGIEVGRIPLLPSNDA
jgi:hypothetical protein